MDVVGVCGRAATANRPLRFTRRYAAAAAPRRAALTDHAPAVVAAGGEGGHGYRRIRRSAGANAVRMRTQDQTLEPVPTSESVESHQ